MTDTSMTRMLDAYIEQRVSPRLFLSSFFRTTPKSFHNADLVEIDVKRGEPRIAIPLPRPDAGARKVESTKSSNKSFKPPTYDMETTINAWSQTQRRAGQNPFEDPDFRKNAREEAFSILGEIEDMVKRGLEVQCSQILQSGKLNLVDAANATVYELDFQPKTTHFVTVGTAWAADGSTGNPESDIDALATVVRRDGKQNPTDLVFGATARARFLKNADLVKRFDNLGQQSLQQLVPPSLGVAQNATLFGQITLGAYKYRCWFYDDYYIDPVTGNPKPYVDDDKMLMIAEAGRRDLTYGSIPMFLPPDARATQFLPTRMSSVEQGFDLSTNVWVSPDGKHLTISAGTRALAIPTAIDTFGCLDIIP